MAKKAEADGLALDWSCFPDPTGLDPHAPMHDSRTLVFAKDRLTPTYREIYGRLLQFRYRNGCMRQWTVLESLSQH
jgi:hypothetical protein